MNNIGKTLAGLVAGLLLPFGLMASEMAVEEVSANVDLIVEAGVLGEIQGSADPLYIDGVLYQLSKADFTPVYISYYIQAGRERIRVERLVAYTLTIPVYGDIGQELLFDINGRSDGHNMNLTASCGTFSASDSGDKYVISRRMTTAQSCTSMKLSFAVSGSPPPFIDLKILIAEAF
ncbi:hypothetical protein [Thalassomonas haliotis]|uniref:Uncharacterized protein n=1 Tax=Thalassomonas haliotis TaxID=485448 RepID=A0ABY7VEA3_9GAMM|nr:hypothetical protein [Thalassomonas haliotis]WDE11878.1 hypothetical protein H3N35_27440 [Thalassomonas haliotis]